MKAILAFLALFNCHPDAQIVQVENLSHPGAYVEKTVLIRHDADIGVIVHELAHACGHDEAGAHWIETIWRQRDI